MPLVAEQRSHSNARWVPAGKGQEDRQSELSFRSPKKSPVARAGFGAPMRQ